MNLRQLLIYFYCLPLKYVALIICAGTIGYLMLWRRYAKLRWFRIGSGVVLGMWLIAVLWATVLNRSTAEGAPAVWLPMHSYREVLNGGNRELLRANFMNVALFYPGGLLLALFLPGKCSKLSRLSVLLVLGAVLSLGIELYQLRFSMGSPEIDDVIHNALGAVLGALPAIQMKQ